MYLYKVFRVFSSIRDQHTKGKSMSWEIIYLCLSHQSSIDLYLSCIAKIPEEFIHTHTYKFERGEQSYYEHSYFVSFVVPLA